MKKLFCILLAFVLVLSSASAYAASSADGQGSPILFRDTPWGASYDEAVQHLPDGVKLYSLDEDYGVSVGNAMYEADKAVYNGYVCADATASSYSLRGVKVAGYELSGLCLRFAFVPNEDGILEKDTDHTALYYAHYKLRPSDPEAAYKDLLAKLTALYGEVDKTNTAGFSIIKTYNTWFGADGTLVTLEKADYSNSVVIYIKYAYLGGDDLLEAAYSALVLEESLSAASDSDGL